MGVSVCSVSSYYSRIVIIALLTVVIAVAGWQYYQWRRFLNTPLITDKPFVYILQPGGTVINLAWDLHRAGSLATPEDLIFLAKEHSWTTKLQAGEYQFNPGTTPEQLLQKMVKGEVVNHSITFIEGWTFKQFLAALNKDPYVKHTLAGLTDTQIMAALGLINKHPEGLFYPDTYLFHLNMSDAQILKRSYNAMHKKLLLAWQNRAPGLLYQNPYQALIVASLIEKETALSQEKPIIAGVILKRLDKKMRLQIDPTVIYALGDNYKGSLKREDLRVISPYNTYKYAGLPPTPIANPSQQSLLAALHPVQSNYLYFVAKGDGGHQFSQTLAEQTEAIKRYLLNKPQVVVIPVPPVGK